MLKIVTVGYNESENLSKLYSSLQGYKGDILFLYVDQESTDNSIEIAKKYGAKVYKRKNKGYADPDKKWLIEKHCKDTDWIFIADADFEFSDKNIIEIQQIIDQSRTKVVRVPISVQIMGITGLITKQFLLFQKKHVTLSNDIHNYISLGKTEYQDMNSYIISDDIKEYGRTISIWLGRIDRYTTVEVSQMQKISKIKNIFLLFVSPIVWFFGYGILHKQFFKGVRGIINCYLQSVYRVSLYSKLYEKNYVKR